MVYTYFAFSIAILTCAWLLGLLIKLVKTSISNKRFANKRGCKPVHRIPQVERVVGLNFLLTQRAALRNHKSMEVNLKRYEDNGVTWSGKMMFLTYINTIDPENIKAILSTNFNDFGLAERQGAFGPLLGKGIFTTDGQAGEHSRALIKPNFSRKQVADLDTFEVHIQHFIDKIPRDASAIDLQPLFFKLTLDSATEFLFGQSVESLTSLEGSDQQIFETAYDLAAGRLGLRYREGMYIGLKDILWPDHEFNAACDTVHKYVDKIVYNALRQAEADDTKPTDEKDRRERYVFLKELVKDTRDPKRLRDELLNILLAGRDTTASLLGTTFHVLARRPDILEKLKVEVNNLEGNRPSFETLKSMKYLQCILNETLRFYTVVPVNARIAIRNTVLPRGGGADRQSPIFVAKGQTVAYSVHCMHRQTSIYGPTASEFIPERWESDLRSNAKWGFLPFNGGPRTCVGQQFALTEASYTIVRLLQEFEGIIDRDGTPFEEQVSLTMASNKGVKVAMIPR